MVAYVRFYTLWTLPSPSPHLPQIQLQLCKNYSKAFSGSFPEVNSHDHEMRVQKVSTELALIHFSLQIFEAVYYQ